MVETQIRRRGVRHVETLRSLRKVPRHLFAPEASAEDAYGDYPIPIGLGQTVSQPYIVGLMTELLEPDGDSRILEIGTGSGYQTAILAEMVKKVFTVERIKELSDAAKKRLDGMGYKNTSFLVGNGYQGWKDFAPYDGIIVTAAADEIPFALKEQLKNGGKLVIPVGGPFEQVLKRITRLGGRFEEETVTGVRFVKLING